ncbi:putative Hemerythrin [Azospirillaceae bacterium]
MQLSAQDKKLVSTIESEHIALSEIISQISSVMGSHSDDPEKVSDFIDEFITLLGEHFKHEEEMMNEKSYPDQENHHLSHEHVLNYLSDYSRLYKNGMIATNVDSGFQLRVWLNLNIYRGDKDFDEWLKKQKFNTWLNTRETIN